MPYPATRSQTSIPPGICPKPHKSSRNKHERRVRVEYGPRYIVVANLELGSQDQFVRLPSFINANNNTHQARNRQYPLFSKSRKHSIKKLIIKRSSTKQISDTFQRSTAQMHAALMIPSCSTTLLACPMGADKSRCIKNVRRGNYTTIALPLSGAVCTWASAHQHPHTSITPLASLW